MNTFFLPLRLPASKINRMYYDVARFLPQVLRPVATPVSSFHSTRQCLKKPKKELSSEPTPFTSSPANIRSMPSIPERNEYQPFIVALSIFVFLIYFLLLREENDIDEELNWGLFDRVPQLEEPHLTQAIPRMRDAGVDTREAEKRLKELREIRLAKEAKQKER